MPAPSLPNIETSPPQLRQVSTPVRLAWIDNLRTFTILLVVNMHACVTYSHVGSWYIMVQPEPSFPVKIPFLIWQGHMQAFFMGLLFFIGGYFAERSLHRKGTTPFLRDRFLRLGLPALLYMLLIHPFMTGVLLQRGRGGESAQLANFYFDYLSSGRVFHGSGPLWFAVALLIFSFFLVLFRLLRPASPKHAPSPNPLALFTFALLLALGTFAVRLIQPIGTNIYNFQLCFFTQYVAAFAAGVAAAHSHWLELLASSITAKRAGIIALIGGPLLLLAVVYLGGEPGPQKPNQFEGGFHWPAFGLAIWEQFSGVGLALGLMFFFTRFFNSTSSLTSWASDRSFAVYVIHAPVLVALTLWMRHFSLNPFLGAFLLTILGLIFSFALADILKRTPLLRALF